MNLDNISDIGTKAGEASGLVLGYTWFTGALPMGAESVVYAAAGGLTAVSVYDKYIDTEEDDKEK